MAELIVIDTIDGVGELVDYLENFNLVAYDCETNGLDSSSTVIGFSICAEETKAYYVILHKWDTALNTLIPVIPFELGQHVLNILKEKQVICHNAIFDCKMAESYFKVDLIGSIHTDTMIAAHLANENRRVGLKELARHYFGQDSNDEANEMKASVLANGGKLTKAQYEMYKCDSQIMAKYGAQDALLTFKLFPILIGELIDQGLDAFFYEAESMPLLRGPTYQLNNTGLKVDTTKLTSLKKQLEAECAEAKSFIYDEIAIHTKDKYPGTNKKNVFSITSNQQLSWLLFGQLNLEFNTLTDGGKEICAALNLRLPYTRAAKNDFIARCLNSVGEIYHPEATINGKKIRAKRFKEPWAYIAVDKRVLTKFAPRFKWVERLLEYQRKNKILNTYVEGIESRTKYGIIHPSFLQHGTTSGRYSSRDPNFQNLPRDDKRIKSCIISRPGRVFVGADYSQLEPRVFAYYSQDERLLKAFDGTTDFYSKIGMEVYNKADCTPQKDGSPDAFGIKYKRLRDLSKVIALASTYGATAHQLAPTTGKSIEDTQRDIDNYFEAFPGVKQMMLQAHALAKKDGQVTNLFGRPRRMPEAKKITKLYGNVPHSELPYTIRNLLNLAVNHRIQSTGASIVNRAAIKFNENTQLAGIECNIVVQVHDSIVIECNEVDAADVSALLQNAMETAVELPGVSLEAIPKIGKTLADV